MAEYARTVVARKQHWCDDERGRWGQVGRHHIPKGAPYVRCVAFPDGDINCTDVPWTVRICSDCYCQYGAEMPPPRRRKRLPATMRNAALTILASADAPRIRRPQ